MEGMVAVKVVEVEVAVAMEVKEVAKVEKVAEREEGKDLAAEMGVAETAAEGEGMVAVNRNRCNPSSNH